MSKVRGGGSCQGLDNSRWGGGHSPYGKWVLISSMSHENRAFLAKDSSKFNPITDFLIPEGHVSDYYCQDRDFCQWIGHILYKDVRFIFFLHLMGENISRFAQFWPIPLLKYWMPSTYLGQFHQLRHIIPIFFFPRSMHWWHNCHICHYILWCHDIIFPLRCHTTISHIGEAVLK